MHLYGCISNGNQMNPGHLSKIDESTIDRVGCGESKDIGKLMVDSGNPLGPPTLSLGSGEGTLVNSNKVTMGGEQHLSRAA